LCAATQPAAIEAAEKMHKIQAHNMRIVQAHFNRIEISVLGGAFENAHQMRFKSASVVSGGRDGL